MHFEANETQVTLAAHAKAGVGARLNLLLYGILGPYAEAMKTPSFYVLPSVELLNFRSPPFNVVDKVLASGSCKPVSKGPALPPASGPDALSLGTPSFTQWTNAWGPTGSDGSIHAVIQEERNWTDLALAIDHRYVTLGNREDTVVKFDDEGALVWSRRYRRDDGAPFLNVIRVAHTADAAMMLLAAWEASYRAPF